MFVGGRIDRAGHLIAESTDAGSTVREYVWLDGMPLAVVADIDTMSPNLYFVHADHLDRPLKMTDASEAIVWNAVCKPEISSGRLFWFRLMKFPVLAPEFPVPPKYFPVLLSREFG